MLVYFTASIVGRKQFKDNYTKIIDCLVQNGCDVISDHILKSDSYSIHSEKMEERINFQIQLDKWLKACDFVVAETSYPSISVGYEISLAVYFGKAVLILYSEGNPPSLLVHHKEERLICEKYNIDNLNKIVEDFIKFCQGNSDIKFTFFINQEMAAYLNKISIKEKIPKSVYLRKLIQQKMKELR